MSFPEHLKQARDAYRDEEKRKLKEDGIKGKFQALAFEGGVAKPDFRRAAEKIHVAVNAWGLKGQVDHDVFMKRETALQCFQISCVEGKTPDEAADYALRRVLLTATAEEFFAPEEPTTSPAP